MIRGNVNGNADNFGNNSNSESGIMIIGDGNNVVSIHNLDTRYYLNHKSSNVIRLYTTTYRSHRCPKDIVS